MGVYELIYASSTKSSNQCWTGHSGPDLLIIGLGNVGLPLAAEAVRSGIAVADFDLNEGVVRALSSGWSRIADVSSDDLADVLSSEFRGADGETELDVPKDYGPGSTWHVLVDLAAEDIVSLTHCPCGEAA